MSALVAGGVALALQALQERDDRRTRPVAAGASQVRKDVARGTGAVLPQRQEHLPLGIADRGSRLEDHRLDQLPSEDRLQHVVILSTRCKQRKRKIGQGEKNSKTGLRSVRCL